MVGAAPQLEVHARRYRAWDPGGSGLVVDCLPRPLRKTFTLPHPDPTLACQKVVMFAVGSGRAFLRLPGNS